MNTIKKLSAMPQAQAHIEIESDGTIHLFSYVTRVAMIDADGWLTIFGLHSQTTKRHIGCFMAEYVGLDFQAAKMMYTNGYKYSLHTGELVEIDENNA